MGAVVERYSLRINSLIRKQARGRNKEEALAVGQLALIEALEEFDPDRGVGFWTFAFPRVRAAIADWAAVEAFGVKRPKNGPGDPRTERFEMRKHPESFDESIHVGQVGVQEDPETLVMVAEERLPIEVFASGLSRADRRVIAWGNNNTRERAIAFVRGK